jgi:hypothetical protein
MRCPNNHEPPQRKFFPQEMNLGKQIRKLATQSAAPLIKTIKIYRWVWITNIESGHTSSKTKVTNLQSQFK